MGQWNAICKSAYSMVPMRMGAVPVFWVRLQRQGSSACAELKLRVGSTSGALAFPMLAIRLHAKHAWNQLCKLLCISAVVELPGRVFTVPLGVCLQYHILLLILLSSSEPLLRDIVVKPESICQFPEGLEHDMVRSHDLWDHLSAIGPVRNFGEWFLPFFFLTRIL